MAVNLIILSYSKHVNICCCHYTDHHQFTAYLIFPVVSQFFFYFIFLLWLVSPSPFLVFSLSLDENVFYVFYGIVVQWLSPSAHCMKVLGSIPQLTLYIMLISILMKVHFSSVLHSVCVCCRKWVWSSTLTYMLTPPWWMASCTATSLRRRSVCRDRPSSPAFCATTRPTSLLWVCITLNTLPWLIMVNNHSFR